MSDKRVPIVNQSYKNKLEHESLIARRKKKALIRRLTAFAIFAAIVFVIIGTTMFYQMELLTEKQEQLEQMEENYNEIKKEQKILQEEITKLQDDEYIGKYARQEYFLSEEGEIIFTVPEDKKSAD